MVSDNNDMCGSCTNEAVVSTQSTGKTQHSLNKLQVNTKTKTKPNQTKQNMGEKVNAKEFFKAAQENDIEKVKFFIENGGNKDERDGDFRTALHWAASKGSFEIVSYLLGRGADPDTNDDSNWTPLMSAVSAGHEAIVSLLIRKPNNSGPEVVLGGGVDVNKINETGRTALHYACSKGYTNIVQMLIGAGATSVKDAAGATPLHRASGKGSIPIIKLLLQGKSNLVKSTMVNAKDENGDTPLHFAAIESHSDVCVLLLEEGDEPEQKNKENKNSLDVATKNVIHAIKQYYSTKQ
eukprot:TRINITY_DN6820_c0_g1_i1.p1 TRINITY_DN6820_c0_g1~~TRINITY_DN6820_c0_g1_i1.p1  ORF type:complete len:294 (-),score=65.43 TRINITY_DN6820_c0_g1_i1:33-914(-)